MGELPVPYALLDDPNSRPLHIALYCAIAALATGEQPVELNGRLLQAAGVRRTPRNRAVKSALAWLVEYGYIRTAGAGYDIEPM